MPKPERYVLVIMLEKHSHSAKQTIKICSAKSSSDKKQYLNIKTNEEKRKVYEPLEKRHVFANYVYAVGG